MSRDRVDLLVEGCFERGFVDLECLVDVVELYYFVGFLVEFALCGLELVAKVFFVWCSDFEHKPCDQAREYGAYDECNYGNEECAFHS